MKMFSLRIHILGYAFGAMKTSFRLVKHLQFARPRKRSAKSKGVLVSRESYILGVGLNRVPKDRLNDVPTFLREMREAEARKYRNIV